MVNPFLGFLSWLQPRKAVPVAEIKEVVKLDLDNIKAGLKRVLPVIRTIARLTPNPFDDAAVAFLEQLLADPAKLETVAK